MTRIRQAFLWGLLCVMVCTSFTAAQYWRRRRGRADTADPRDRNGVPLWEVDEGFPNDMFTFARANYSSWSDRGDRGKWGTDFPDSDLNFSFRLQQLTSLKVDPKGQIVRLTDDALLNFPFLYVIEPGHMSLMEDEVIGLRRYLTRGGFMMVDDFWGEDEWDVFYSQLRRVFPERRPQELPLSHEIFHIVYDLEEKPQVPSIHHAMNGYRTERFDAQEAHYRAVFDDDGRIMVLICHNTDLGDGWEREGVSAAYFEEYSEKWAYPMGINIVVYAMTH